jgi:hypothetical protein
MRKEQVIAWCAIYDLDDYCWSLMHNSFLITVCGDLRVKARVPTHAARGDAAKLHCNYETSGADGKIYSVKWYKNENEFFRYQPWSNPPAQIFVQPGVTVDVSTNASNSFCNVHTFIVAHCCSFAPLLLSLHEGRC